MKKRDKKLALKRESLRNLSEAELTQVNGGWYNWEWYIYKMPVIGTTSKTEGYNLQLYYW